MLWDVNNGFVVDRSGAQVRDQRVVGWWRLGMPYRVGVAADVLSEREFHGPRTTCRLPRPTQCTKYYSTVLYQQGEQEGHEERTLGMYKNKDVV